MNRYEIALGKRNKAFRFPPTQSITKTLKYMNFCAQNRTTFVADNIPVFILEAAMVKMSETTKIPIVVDSKEKALLLSTAHSHSNILSIDNEKISHYSYVICYNCSPSSITGSKPYLVIYAPSR